MPRAQVAEGGSALETNRAYALLDIRAVDDSARVIEGIASTPTPDRMGDVVEPMGAKFALPMPLLWQHDSSQPIGQVTFAKPTKAGIPFKAQLVHPDAVDSPTLKDRLQLAWDSIKNKLVGAVSIGFRDLAHEVLADGGWRFTQWEWLELSAVTIPANGDATITTIKSIDRGLLAASGREVPSDARRILPAPRDTKAVKLMAATPHAAPKEGRTPMPKTIAEQISAFEATRQAKAARVQEIMEAAAESGSTLDAAQGDEHDTLSGEIKSIDEHLKRLEDMQKMNLQRAAAPVGDSADTAAASRALRGSEGLSVRVEVPRAKDLPKGIGFTRYALAMARSKGNLMQAHHMAKANERWMAETPDVEAVLRPRSTPAPPPTPPGRARWCSTRTWSASSSSTCAR
jgi:hypothetical protein